MSKHPDKVHGLTAEELAKLFARTTYEYQTEFFVHLAELYKLESLADKNRGYNRLSTLLDRAWQNSDRLVGNMLDAWNICKDKTDVPQEPKSPALDSGLPKEITVDIIIPSCKDIEEVAKQLAGISGTRSTKGQIIFTGEKASAAKNRNIGLNKSTADIIIMMDDDMDGFSKGWDVNLIEPLLQDDNNVMVSARLLNEDGTLAYMLSENNDINKAFVEIKKREVPTACIAFRSNDIRFDENFIGSGWEDNDFSFAFQSRYPKGKFIINNYCQLIHLNEKKNQHGRYWEHNKAYFNKKHGTSR